MREQFEQSIINSPSYKKLIFQHGERLFIFEDGQYKIAAVQLAWEIWQERDKEKWLLRNTVNALDGLNRILKGAGNHARDMQNQINSALDNLRDGDNDSALQILSQNYIADWHHVSCTYKFELAFLNMDDSPELRKLYWSAKGQSHFNDKDQVIVPELVECPVCKEGEHV